MTLPASIGAFRETPSNDIYRCLVGRVIIFVIFLDENAKVADNRHVIADLFPDLKPPDEQPIGPGEVVSRIRPIATRIRRVSEAALAAANAAVQGGLAAPHGCFMNEGAFAGVLYSYTVVKATGEFGSDPEVHVQDGLRFLLWYSGLVLQFKKLGRDGHPSYNDTRASTALARQLLLPDPVITIGVTVSALRDRIVSFELICPRDEKRDWWRTALPDGAAGLAPVVPFRPTPPLGGDDRFGRRGGDQDKDKDADTDGSGEGE